MSSAVRWIGVDWGTSNLRLWALDDSDRVLAERQDTRGMGTLQPADYEPAFLEVAGDLLAADRRTPVLVCGMAGARQGWAEAPYAHVPCHPVGTGAIQVPTHDTRMQVRILPGLAQAEPADVMRGEETQIAGFLATAPGFVGTICLPGTHTKWVTLQSGQVTQFRTMMTGELFSLLGRQSVLRHSAQDGWNAEAFDEAVAAAISHPEALLGDLFSVRAADLLTDVAPGAGRARLSGLLIGAELAAAQSFWQGTEVVVLGASDLAELYQTALTWLGARARMVDSGQTTLDGLTAAFHQQDWPPTAMGLT